MFDFLTSPDFALMTMIVLVLAGIPLYVAWRCLNGDTRTWGLLPPIPFQISKHNTWPFMLLMVGIAFLTAFPAIPFEYERMEGARQMTWNLFFIPLGGVILSFFWWPLALTPRWFRNWAMRAKTDPEANPWTPDEVEQVKTAPESKRRNRALRDIQRLVGEDAVEGMAPKDFFERKADAIKAELDAEGLPHTPEGQYELARRKKERKDQEKARRKAGG